MDIRRAARALLRQPELTLLAVLALALGIGLPTAMFSFVDAAVLRGLPLPDAQELLHLERRRTGESGEGRGAAARDYLAWREQQRTFEDIFAFTSGTATLRIGTGVDQQPAAWLTTNAFEVLRASPLAGRAFRPTDAEARVALIGERIWRERLGASAAAIGSTVHVNGLPHVIVGVMPRTFRFPAVEEVWLPMTVQSPADEGSFGVIGRLRSGASRADAAAELAVVARRVEAQYPETNREIEVVVKPVTERFMGETPTRTMYVVLAAVLLVLVVACTNVANLLLVRGVHRARELAIATALGASRMRIVRQVLAESLVLALTGAALGLLVARAGTAGLERLFVGRMPYWVDLRLDLRVLAFALGLALFATLMAGVLPALRSTKGDLTGVLRDESRGATGLRVGRVMNGLVVLEMSLSLGLLATTGLLLRSVQQVRQVDFGYRTSDVFTARATPPAEDPAERQQYFQRLEAALAAVPGVSASALASALPGTRAERTPIGVEGIAYASDDERPVVRRAAVSSGFFTTFSVRPRRGRVFDARDRADTEPVVIINERLAAQQFAGQDPVGRRIRVGGEGSPFRTIVGVVPDLWMGSYDSSDDRNPAGVYVPLAQSTPAGVALAARVMAGDPLAITDDVRRAAFVLQPDVPLHDVKSLPRLLRDHNWYYDMIAGIVGACGAAALFLATVGLYGVIAFAVRRRRREIGIRMAVGADARRVLALFLRRGLAQLAPGVVLGLTLASLLAAGVSSLLFQVSPRDPFVFGLSSALLVAAGLFATLGPALRGARLDPLEALRSD